MYMGYGYGMDITYILVLIGAALCMLASAGVRSTYSKYAKVSSVTGMTGADAVQRILQMSGVTDVSIEHVSGQLTDHYDPSKQVVRLSDATYASDSVAALGVAAHECGHVMQHETGYIPLNIRTALVPVANIGSNLGLPIVVLGLMLGLSQTLCMVGIVMFLFGVLFQIVTLPVEFDASRRGLEMLENYGILGSNEL
ncbi:MAG: zinc metallopeptidase, partial [Lachnospiraceae bacterium]|nr:zinc metallopeptidase [Lachnospiraceae bacterium]